MAYLSRMGLWGPSTAFRDFDAFLDTMKRRGVSFMEMLAMEMKMEGKYVARGLSFNEAEFLSFHRVERRPYDITRCSGCVAGRPKTSRFVELSIVLNEAQTEIYNAAVDVWQDVRRSTEVAIPMTGNSSGLLWRTFCGMEVGPVNDFVSPTREILRNYILNNFPVKYEDPKAEGAKGGIAQKQQQRPRLQTNQIYAGADSDDEGNGVMPIDFGPGGTTSLVVYNSPGAERDAVSAELLTMRAELLARVDDLQLPPNFLDELIDEFGGPDTGLVRAKPDSQQWTPWHVNASLLHGSLFFVGVKEREKFQAGKCFIAIISDAASTGISLHASLSVANQRRRIHLTIELPWSADKAIQQLGRTHRSNQSSGPVYKGDRRAASSVDLSTSNFDVLGPKSVLSNTFDLALGRTSNFDSALGRKSLRRMYDCLVLESRSLPPGVLLKDVYMDHKSHSLLTGVLLKDVYSDHKLQATAIMRLHQRLRKHCDTMGIGVGGSGEGLPGKADTVVEDKPMGKAEAAKSEGKLSEGLSDLRGRSVTLKGSKLLWRDKASRSVTLKGSKLLWRDKASGLTTTRNDFDIDRGVSFQPGQRGVFTITKPNTGVSYFEMDRDDLYSRYERVPQDSPDLEMDWEATYERSLTQCMHGTECKMGMSCAAGRRITQATILSGSVVRIWGTLEQVLLRHELNLSKADRTMRVVRVELDAEQEASLFPISSKDQNSNAVVVMGEEPPTPLDTKSMAKAFKAPKTLLDFFRPQGLTQKSNTTTARGAGVGGTPLQAAAGGNTALRRAAAAPPLSKAPQPPPRPGPSEEVFIDLDDEDDVDAIIAGGPALDEKADVDMDLQQLPSKRTKLADAPMDSYDIPAGSGADGGGGGRSCTDLQLLPSKRTKLDDTPKDSYGTPAAPPLNPRPKPAVSEPHKPRQNARPRTAVNATGSSEIQKADAANAKKEAGLELLIGMGFSREMSEKSLWLAHGNSSG
eukprot:gene28197-31293_t